MAGLELAEVILAVIIGTLAAIVYSLRVLILLERRVASMESNIQRMTAKVLQEEKVIERLIRGKKARSTRKTTKTRKTKKSTKSKKRKRK